jgi:hypothetical protein
MGVYNTFEYGLNSGITYGRASALQFSVEPFTAVATGPTSASVTWATPGGEYLGVRLLRNQQGYSEHYEDGVVLVNEVGSSSITSINDGDGSFPLTSGKEAYYSIWLLLPDFTWRLVGTANCLIPREHGEYAPDGTLLVSSTDKFASIIPRTYLATGKTFLDEIDQSSDLYQFLSGMSLVLDEQYTLLENLTSDSYGTSSSLALTSAEVSELGLTELPEEAMLTSKRLVRQAISNYSKKGTEDALQSFVSALTGYGVELSVSPNLMLSMQDSTFYKGAGNWSLVPGSSSSATFQSIERATSQNISPWTIDKSWVGEIVVSSGTASLRLGMDNPTTKGIPVEAGKIYEFNGQVNQSVNTSLGCVVTWYDKQGNVISSQDTSGVTLAGTATGVWKKFTSQVTAPVATYDVDGVLLTEPAMFAGISLGFSTTQTTQLDMLSFHEALPTYLVDYYEARAIDAYVYPSKTNYIYNPSFKIKDGGGNPVGWSMTGLTLESAVIPGVSNGGSVLVGSTVSNTIKHELIAGEYYTLSVYAKSRTSSNVNVSLRFSWDDGITTGLVDSTAVAVGSSWKRVSLRVYLPDTVIPEELLNSANDGALFQVTGSASISMGAFQLERTTVASDYFDGSMSLSNAFYSGDNPNTITSNEDISFLYYNFGTRVNLLELLLPSQIPLNRAYTVTYGETGSTYLQWYPAGPTPGTGDYNYERKLSLVALAGVTS